MPCYYLPPVLYNVVCAYNERLPATARSVFETQFFQRLEVIPHPDQSPDDTSEEFSLIPSSPGTGHLDAICRWYLLALLVDPKFGVLELTESPGERIKVLEVAVLFRRWLEADYPSETEWNDIPEEKAGVEPELTSTACMTAQWLKPLGADNPTLVTTMIDMAACCGWRLGPPPGTPLLAPSIFGRMFDRGLNWLARRLGRGPTQVVGDPTHYLWQATWLLDLMHLRWLPTDPQEEALFRGILRGSRHELSDYASRLRKNKVDLALIPRMERTLKRMHELLGRAVLAT